MKQLEENQLFALRHLAARLDLPTRQVAELLHQAGELPVAELNGEPLYDLLTAARVCHKLSKHSRDGP